MKGKWARELLHSPFLVYHWRMPEVSRFKTEKGQRVAVAVVTLTLFLCAMGLAVIYTVNHTIDFTVDLQPRQIDGIEIELPTGWHEEHDNLGNTILLEPRDQPQYQPRRRITFRHLPLGVTQPPLPVLRQKWVETTGFNPQGMTDNGQLHRFRNRSLIGLRYHATYKIPNNDVHYRCYQILLTETGRDYWLITLEDFESPRSAKNDDNVALIDRMAKSASIIQTSAAKPDQLNAARITAALPDGLEGRVEPDWIPGEPLTLIPMQGGVHLGVLRVIGTIDSGIADRLDHFSPTANLRRAFLLIHQRYPNENELTTSEQDGHAAWRLGISIDQNTGAPNADGAARLMRERMYVKLNPHHGLLLEYVAEPAAHADMARLINAIVSSHTTSITSSTVSVDTPDTDADASPMSRAVDEGGRLAKTMRTGLGKRFIEGWTFMRERTPRETLGVRMTRWYRTDDPHLPLWGRSTHRQNDDRLIHRAAWRSSENGRFIIGEQHTRKRTRSEIQQQAYRVQVVDDQFRLAINPGSDSANQGTLPVPAGYIPQIAAEVWPMDAVYNLAGPEPTLIWQIMQSRLPQPVWLTATTFAPLPGNGDNADRAEPIASPTQGSITNPPNGAVAVLAIRPMMELNTTRVWLDANGQVVQRTEYGPTNNPAGEQRVDLIRITQQAALKEFSILRETIFQWLLEQPDPGMQP